MNIDLFRKYRKPDYTIGILSIDGQRVCETLEDTDRGITQQMTPLQVAQQKIKGKTAIPTGIYNVNINFSPRFRKELPILENVTGFEGIRIHSGNTAADTEGCILPGKNTKVGMVTNSRVWTENIVTRIKKALTRGEKVKINIHW